MKFLKIIALVLALSMLSVFAVACSDEDDGSADTTTGSGETTAAPFLNTITVTALDENGDEVPVIEVEDVEYNGLKDPTKLTLFDIVKDYCDDNGITCDLDEDTGRFVKIDTYTIAEGGFVWKYEINGKELKDYDTIVKNGDEITVYLEAVVAE